jgi:Flp pilus assembly protein TadG
VPLGIAFVRRGTNKKAKIAAAAQAAAIAAANEKQQQQQPAFTANISPAAPEQCKEAREKRRSFDIYSGTGCYKLPPDTGDAKNALGAANATEKPSAIVAELIAKGMSNATIREYLGYV